MTRYTKEFKEFRAKNELSFSFGKRKFFIRTYEEIIAFWKWKMLGLLVLSYAIFSIIGIGFEYNEVIDVLSLEFVIWMTQLITFSIVVILMFLAVLSIIFLWLLEYDSKKQAKEKGMKIYQEKKEK